MYLLWVSILSFFICIHYVICLLHKSRSEAGQCDQCTRLTSIVDISKEKIRTKIVESVGIRNCTLKILPMAFLTPSEAVPASMTMEFSYH